MCNVVAEWHDNPLASSCSKYETMLGDSLVALLNRVTEPEIQLGYTLPPLIYLISLLVVMHMKMLMLMV